MLCRAALAVLAVTCTFPSLAHAQGTELVQLKDLVCVLWFSGLKKEDMDVNLLTKLERHKINFDMKNETMQQECSVNTLALTGKSETPITTTIASSTTTDIPKIINAANKDEYLDPIVKFMNEFQKTSNSVIVNDNNEATPALTTAKRINIMFNPSYRISDQLSEGSMKKKEPIKANVRTKVEIENILSMWKNIANSKDKQTQKDYDVTSQGEDITHKNQIILRKPVTSRPYYSFNLNTKEPVIEVWLADFIDKHINRRPITTTTTQRAVVPHDLGDIFLPFYKDLFHQYNSRQIVQDTVDDEDKDLIDKFKLHNRDPSNTSLSNKSPVETTTNEPNKFDVLLKNMYREKIGRRKSTSSKEDEGQKMSKQMIKEIADNIKAMILKDLGPLVKFTSIAIPDPHVATLPPPPPTTVTLPPPTLTTITLSPPTLTTAAVLFPTPTILNLSAISATRKKLILNDAVTTMSNKSQNFTRNVDQVMKKILDLYEQIKVISDKFNISKEATNNADKQNYERNHPVKKVLSPDILQHDMFNRMTNVKHLLMNPFRDLTRQEMQEIPSIIQTNSREIAPLMLPMTSPLKIYNQIVVVTTAKPTTKVMGKKDKSRGRYEKFMDVFKNRAHASFDKSRSQKLSIPPMEHKTFYPTDHKRHPSFTDYYTNRYNKEIPNKHKTNHDLFERMRNYRSRHTGRINENFKYKSNDDVNENAEHINYFDYISSLMAKVPANRHGEKFHEKLETGDGIKDDNTPNLGHIKDLFEKSQDIIGQNKEMFQQSKHIVEQNKELIGENKDTFGQSKELFRHNKKSFRQNMELFEENDDSLGQNKELIRHTNKELLGQSKDILGHIKEMLGGRETAYENPVASRQQQPLNVRNAYDDTHFRNFLKTQQQVNDMLERILETKNTLPYSVETI